MKFMGLDLNDEIVDQYFQHVRCGYRDENSLRLEILNLLNCELGTHGIEESLAVYGKEECEAQVHKVLKEMIETFYRPDPIIILGLKIDSGLINDIFTLYHAEESEENLKVIEDVIVKILQDIFHTDSVEEAEKRYKKDFIELTVNARLFELVNMKKEEK